MLKYPNVNWSLPILFSNDELIISISDIMQRLELKNPITYAYGMVPSLWTGGRQSAKKTQNKLLIKNLLEMVIKTGSIPTFTFSKYDISPDDLNDSFCNWLLDFGVENNCNFIITADLLYKHIKSRYPQAKCVSSVLKPIYELELQTLSETDYYNKLMEKYDRVVVRPEYSLNTLLKEHEAIKDISKIEVLINQICVPNCKYAQKEHLMIPKSDWDNYNNQPTNIEPYCPRKELFVKHGLKSIYKTTSLMFTEDEINNLVYNLGIKNLKLQGRNYDNIHNTRIINNYIFEQIGDFQNISSIIWGKCEDLKNREVLPL